jgi:hypothetical protein
MTKISAQLGYLLSYGVPTAHITYEMCQFIEEHTSIRICINPTCESIFSCFNTKGEACMHLKYLWQLQQIISGICPYFIRRICHLKNCGLSHNLSNSYISWMIKWNIIPKTYKLTQSRIVIKESKKRIRRPPLCSLSRIENRFKKITVPNSDGLYHHWHKGNIYQLDSKIDSSKCIGFNNINRVKYTSHNFSSQAQYVF